MLAQGEVLGILQMDQRDRARIFSRDEQTLTQHLANQIGVAVKLLDQRSVREQLFRTEKLAAVGQLISGIVNDLRTPLAAIANCGRLAQLRPPATDLPRRTWQASRPKRAAPPRSSTGWWDLRARVRRKPSRWI
jgi:K+-sensing histidine kinase KdpD